MRRKGYKYRFDVWRRLKWSPKVEQVQRRDKVDATYAFRWARVVKSIVFRVGDVFCFAVVVRFHVVYIVLGFLSHGETPLCNTVCMGCNA